MFGHGHEVASAELTTDAQGLDDGSRAALAALRAAGAALPEDLRERFSAQLADLLGKRLQLQADRDAHPTIGAERIEAPIIICGMPRSGTSLLHALLALDPGNRAPRAWELMTPSPPAPAADEQRRRMASASAAVRSLLAAMPDLLKAHPYWDTGGEATVECEDIMQLSFVSPYFSAFFKIPDYETWLADADYRIAYRVHREFLQHLQWGTPGRRWALKGVTHVAHLDAIAETYPDACLVWPHRDPAEQFASMATLVAITRGAGDPTELREIFDSLLRATVQRLQAALAHPFVRDGRILHLQFGDLNRDPLAAIRTIYEGLGQAVSAEHARHVAAWLAAPANDPARHGRVGADLERFGSSLSDVRRQLEFYYDSGLIAMDR